MATGHIVYTATFHQLGAHVIEQCTVGANSELHAGPNFATRPGKGVTRPDPTRPAKIHEFLDPTRHDPRAYPQKVKITRRLA